MTELTQPKNTSSWWIWLALAITLVLTYQMYVETAREEAEAVEAISEANLSNKRLAPTRQTPQPTVNPLSEAQTQPQQGVTAAQYPTATASKQPVPIESQMRSISDDSHAASDFTSRAQVNILKSSILFLPKQWEPPPAPVKKLPPPPPTAPPLPFVYVGEMDDMPTGKKVILMAQQKLHLPMIGEKLLSVWRLDKVDAQLVYFTYMPLNITKTLTKSAKSPSLGNVNLSAPIAPLEPEAAN